jgi:pyruvate formate lyase activating enzyme
LPSHTEHAGAQRLRVGGLQRFSSIDFPGRLAAVVFCQGCPWRCSYCHNPELLDPTASTPLAWDEVLSFLHRRRALLDAVVFSGGEPTLQSHICDAIADVRSLGFEVGLHTAGMYPQRLSKVLPRLDWIGLDIKAPWEQLDRVTGSRDSAARVRESLQYVLASGVPFECRTTWAPDLFSPEDLCSLAEHLANVGVTRWALQERRGGSPRGAISRELIEWLGGRFEAFTFRSA